MIKNVIKFALDGVSNTGVPEIDNPINALLQFMANLCTPLGVGLLIIAGIVLAFNKITEQSSHANKFAANLFWGGLIALSIRGLIFLFTGFSI